MDFQTWWSNSRYSVIICDKRCEQKLPQSDWKMLPEVSVCQEVAEAALWRKLEAFYKLASHRAHRRRDSSLAAFCGSAALTSVAAVPLDLGTVWMVNCRCLESEQKVGLSLTSTHLNFYIHEEQSQTMAPGIYGIPKPRNCFLPNRIPTINSWITITMCLVLIA